MQFLKQIKEYINVEKDNLKVEKERERESGGRIEMKYF